MNFFFSLIVFELILVRKFQWDPINSRDESASGNIDRNMRDDSLRTNAFVRRKTSPLFTLPHFLLWKIEGSLVRDVQPIKKIRTSCFSFMFLLVFLWKQRVTNLVYMKTGGRSSGIRNSHQYFWKNMNIRDLLFRRLGSNLFTSRLISLWKIIYWRNSMLEKI